MWAYAGVLTAQVLVDTGAHARGRGVGTGALYFITVCAYSGLGRGRGAYAALCGAKHGAGCPKPVCVTRSTSMVTSHPAIFQGIHQETRCAAQTLGALWGRRG